MKMRRNFLRAATCMALGGIPAANAAQSIAPRKLPTNVVQSKGNVLVNRQRLSAWQWLQTGDETLDYRYAEKYYAACTLRIQAGGDHSYQGFAQQLPDLLNFAGIGAEQFETIDFAAL